MAACAQAIARVLGTFASLVALDAPPDLHPRQPIDNRQDTSPRWLAALICPGSPAWLFPTGLAAKPCRSPLSSQTWASICVHGRRTTILPPGEGAVPTTGCVAAPCARRAGAGATIGPGAPDAGRRQVCGSVHALSAPAIAVGAAHWGRPPPRPPPPIHAPPCSIPWYRSPPLSGARRRGGPAQRACASAPATPHASPAPRRRVGASNTPCTPKQGEETRAKDGNDPPVEKRTPSPIGPRGQMCCALSLESRPRDRCAPGGVVPVCERGAECSWWCHW
jgi:hypothetical protein